MRRTSSSAASTSSPKRVSSAAVSGRCCADLLAGGPHTERDAGQGRAEAVVQFVAKAATLVLDCFDHAALRETKLSHGAHASHPGAHGREHRHHRQRGKHEQRHDVERRACQAARRSGRPRAAWRPPLAPSRSPGSWWAAGRVESTPATRQRGRGRPSSDERSRRRARPGRLRSRRGCRTRTA